MQTQPQLQNYVQVILRRRWVILTFFIVIVVSVLIGSIKQTPIYEATATLLIEPASPQVISTQEVTPMGPKDFYAYKDYYETQYKLIKGRVLLKKVADSLDLNNSNPHKEISPAEKTLISEKAAPPKNFLVKAAGFLGLEYKSPRERNDPVKKLLKTVNVMPVKNSQLVEIRVQDQSPYMAAKIANTVADEYIRQNLQRNLSATNNAGEWLSKKIEEQRQKMIEAELALSKYRKQQNINILPRTTDERAMEDIKAEYARLQALRASYSRRYTYEHPEMIELKARINSLRNKIDGMEGFDTGNKTMEYRVLEREVQTNKHMYETLLARLKEIDLSSTLNVNNISIIDRAEVPEKPVKPNLPLNMVLSVMVGLVMGIGLGLFVDYLDTTIKSPQDVKNILETRFLGSIPEIVGKDAIKKDKIVHLKPTSPVSEAYRDIRTEILSLIPQKKNLTILVTSAEPKAGKTVTCANLAIALAQKDSKVLIVDSDLRKPQIHNIFNMDRHSGLSEYLLKNADLDSIIKDVNIENLKVITSGKVPRNPAEVLSSVRMEVFIHETVQKFDFVIFDSPPAASVTDPIILANLTDAVIQVVRSGKAPVPIVLRIKEKLANMGTKFLGVILNDLKIYHGDYYSYKYYRYYGEEVRRKSSEV